MPYGQKVLWQIVNVMVLPGLESISLESIDGYMDFINLPVGIYLDYLTGEYVEISAHTMIKQESTILKSTFANNNYEFLD